MSYRLLPFALTLCALLSLSDTASAEEPAQLIYLDQGWDDAARQKYYYSPQGSMITPYEWFLALEQPYAETLFRDDAHLSGFGYLPNKAGEHNPDGLPVGFVASRREGRAWFGMTCAACHTGQFTFQGKTVRLDGGSGLPHVTRFQQTLLEALRATRGNEAKFQRFATRVLGHDADAARQAELRAELEQQIEWHADWAARMRPAHEDGFGRWDAMHVAFNIVAGATIRDPSNYRTPLAPISYPCIWLSHDLNHVLWNGSVHNILSRGIGEAVLVFGRLSLSNDLKFSSSVDLWELDAMYDALYSLKPPVWPEQILGKIDRDQANRGAKIYEREGCARCHANTPPYPRTDPNQFGKRFIDNPIIPLAEVGTDPLYAVQFLSRTANPGITAPLLKGTMFENQSELPVAILFLDALRIFTDVKLKELNVTKEQSLDLNGRRGPVTIPTTPDALKATIKGLTGYKTQPLMSVWSTAPYLHNGSVPNLYQLLLPPEQRVKSFTVGHREFDPKHVGYRSGPQDGPFTFDTTIPGNSNSGHTWGTQLTDDERWALIEYLKTL